VLKTFKLEEIVEINIGKTPSRDNPNYWDINKTSSNVWVSIRDISAINSLYIDDSREYISDEGAKLFKEVPKDTLIMSFKLSIGKFAITKIDLRTNEAIASFKIKDETLICTKYLYYYLSSLNWDMIAGHDIKVKGKTLNKAKLKEILITLPPLKEQQRIVSEVEIVFAEINKVAILAKDRVALLNKFRDSLLIFLLNLNKTKKIVKLGEVCLVKRGTSITRKETKNGNIPVIAGGRKATYFHNKHNREVNSITVSGSGASAGLVNYWSIPIFASDCSTVEPKDKKQYSKFVYYYLKSIQEYIYKNLISGAAQPHVYAKDIANLDFPLLSIEEQKNIVAKLDKLFSELSETNTAYSQIKNNYKSLKLAILSKKLQSKESK
jgi:type I restriction enzyme, S subunit